MYGTTQAEHDANLRATLQRLKENGLKLNKSKCLFNKQSLAFVGYIFSKSGMSPDPKKIDVVKHLKTPTDSTMVRSLLGMTNFFARFIKSYATITEPLPLLTKKNCKWEWTSKHMMRH